MSASSQIAQKKKQKAIKLLQNGDFAGAATILEQLLGKFPRDVEAMSMLGNVYGQSGRIEQAIDIMERVIAIHPGDINTLNNLGVACMMIGNRDKAADYIEQVVSLQPGDIESVYNLACIRQEQGELGAAIALFNKVLEKEPGAYDALINMGVALKKQSRDEEAIHSFKRAIDIKPKSAEAHYNLGSLYSRRDEFSSAENCFLKALDINKDYADAHRGVANLFLQQGRIDDALPHYEQAARIAPGDFRNTQALAYTHVLQGRPGKAIELYQQALEHNQQDARLFREYARVLYNLGNYDEAAKAINQALSLKPDDVESMLVCSRFYREASDKLKSISILEQAHKIDNKNTDVLLELASSYSANGMADKAMDACKKAQQIEPDNFRGKTTEINLLTKHGEFDRAIEVLEPLLEGPIRAQVIGMQFANLCKHMGKCEEASRYLEEVLHDCSDRIPVQIRRNSLFTLGRLYDDLGNYDKAFACFREANRLTSSHFECIQHHDAISSIISTYSRDNFGGLVRSGIKSDLPVFIIGMPRSGTSLVEQILDSHHDMCGAGELTTIAEFQNELHSLPVNDMGRCDELAQRYLQELHSYSGSSRHVSDKMPTNFMHLGLVQQLFPAARIIHILRNPLDTCLSIYSWRFSGNHPYSYNLEHLGCYYNEYRRLMKHWQNVLEIPVFNIHYEQLVEDQENWSRQLVDFCGLEWDENCMTFYKNKRIVNTASNQQVRQPVYKSSVQRWRNYEKQLQPLIDALEPEYRREAGVKNWDY